MFEWLCYICKQIGETCSMDDNKCDGGLRCGTCPASGNTRPRCMRIQPIGPTSKVNGLPFNRYSWLTTHNSYALSGSRSISGSPVLGPANQEDDVATQLRVSKILNKFHYIIVVLLDIYY